MTVWPNRSIIRSGCTDLPKWRIQYAPRSKRQIGQIPLSIQIFIDRPFLARSKNPHGFAGRRIFSGPAFSMKPDPKQLIAKVEADLERERMRFALLTKQHLAKVARLKKRMVRLQEQSGQEWWR